MDQLGGRDQNARKGQLAARIQIAGKRQLGGRDQLAGMGHLDLDGRRQPNGRRQPDGRGQLGNRAQPDGREQSDGRGQLDCEGFQLRTSIIHSGVDSSTGEEGIKLIPLESVVNGGQFVCNVCGYTAATSFNLNRHMKSFHSESQVACPRSYCKQVFPTKFFMRAHLAECYINCVWNTCDKKFKYQNKYDAHKRAHENYAKRLI